MGKPHAVVVPYPAQGHVIPLMELSHCLVNHGFKITFINTDFNHKRVMDSISTTSDGNKEYCPIRLISIPDGLGPEEDRNDLGKLTTAIQNSMPRKLEEVIRMINKESVTISDGDMVTCLIADENVGWALEVAEKMGIRRAAYFPASAALLAQGLIIPKLIHDGIIDEEGTPTENQIIQLSPTLPTMNTENLTWNCIGDSSTNKIIFKMVHKNTQVIQSVDWIICNSAFELEPAAFTLFPKIVPIGPLLASSRLGNLSGHFWPEDSTCLNWLDQQPAGSVIYVAFGSFTVFQQIQFQELALGLELTGERFLWVTRPDSISIPYPDGFQTRISNRGRIVGWAPQQNVLSHPSVSCFLSHCGWNSTTEGVSHGVPFLCWPYFSDQFLNQDYICDIWKIGLRLDKDENGIISQTEIVEKVKQLLHDNKEIKVRSLKLMELVKESVKDGGSSSKNLKCFVEGISREHNNNRIPTSVKQVMLRPFNGKPLINNKQTEMYAYISSSIIRVKIEEGNSQFGHCQQLAMRNRPHVVVIPYPAQGHVIPLMQLSHILVNHGFKVTFINTEYNDKRILNSLSSTTTDDHKEFPIHFISIPDGLGPEENRNDLGKLTTAITTFMPGKLEEVIRQTNEQEINDDENGDVVTCVIADDNMGWALEVAEKIGLRRAVFFPLSAAIVVQASTIPKLIEDGIIDDDGNPTKAQIIQLSPTMPAMNTEQLSWNSFGDPATNKILFKYILNNTKISHAMDWMICNSFYELEPTAFTLYPKILPIGPLVANNRLGQSSGHFWPQDSTCLNWLDQQLPRSVIYVAFGSFTIFEQIQFQELAFGLELSGKHFLWVSVTRPDSSHPYPDGFQTRISTRGLIVGWAPQQNVLSHPSVGCFLSHCGWNSTLEGVCNGVSFLCWPYFADQFLDQDYICDIWKIGLNLNKNENGIVSRTEIMEKIKQVIEDEGIRTRALKLMEMARESVKDGGSSSNNFKDFVERIK